jgi:cobalt/nickel transport system permease protein
MNLPAWFAENAPSTFHPRGGGGGRGHVEKTLAKIAELSQDAITSEKYASVEGFLQGIDPRKKLVAILLLIVATSFLRDMPSILVVYALTLCVAFASKIDLGFFIKRVWFFIPVFSGIVALPSIFSIFTPGEPLITLISSSQGLDLWLFKIYDVSITKEGVLGASLFVSRVATSVSLAVLLTLTTRWNELMKSLRVLYVPPIFILVLSMTYQYILILMRTAQDMHLAKKSRTIYSDASYGGIKKERDWVASRMGALLGKSYTLSEETHSAMLSRGFRGDVK